MPRYAYQKPRARMYGYNLDYYKNYYKPMSHFIEAENKDVTEKPGAQTLAERLKKFPMDGSIYPDRACSEPRLATSTELAPFRKLTSMEEGDIKIAPLHLKHPYRLPVEDERRRCWLVDPVWFPSPWEWDCIWVPPHENRSWPHFGVESYRQLILKYLELRNRRYKIQVKLCPIHRHLLDNGLDEVLTVDNVVV